MKKITYPIVSIIILIFINACTGYKPIIGAAKNLNKKKKYDHFNNNKKNTINLLKKIKGRSIVINNNSKKYFAPRSVIELKKILNLNTNSKLLGGGTDVSLIVTKERRDLDSLIYMNSIQMILQAKEQTKV